MYDSVIRVPKPLFHKGTPIHVQPEFRASSPSHARYSTAVGIAASLLSDGTENGYQSVLFRSGVCRNVGTAAPAFADVWTRAVSSMLSPG